LGTVNVVIPPQGKNTHVVKTFTERK